MKEMKDSGVEWIGEIPQEWSLRRLRFLCNITTGNMDTQDNDPEGQYPFYVRSPIVEHSNNYTFDNEAVLMAGDGVGAGKVFHYVNGKYGCHQRVYSMSDFNEVVGKYLYYYLQENFYKKIEESNAKSTVDSVRLPMLKDFPVVFPDVYQQKEIVSYLNSKCANIDEVIKKQQTIIEKLKEYKLSIITEAVIRGLDKKIELKDSGNKYLGQVPIHWSVVKFGRIATIKSNLVSPVEYQDYPQISPDNIDKGSGKLLGYNTVEESGVISWNHLFYTGQIIYSKIRPLLDKVIIAPFDGLCSADMYPIETDCNKYFIVFVILSAYFHAQVALVTETRVKMPKINQNELSSIVVAIPPVNEQNQIAEYLRHKCRKVDKNIEQRGKIIETLQKYKKSIVYEMVTGKREVL